MPVDPAAGSQTGRLVTVVFSEITALRKAVGKQPESPRPLRSRGSLRSSLRFAQLRCLRHPSSRSGHRESGALPSNRVASPPDNGPFQSRPPRLAGEPTRVGLKGATRSTYETTQAPQRSEERSESQESNASGLSRCSPLLQLTHH